VEDAGAEPYLPTDPEHRRVAARWLATVQYHAGDILVASDLPERGAAHYLVHLLESRQQVARQLRRLGSDPEAAPVLDDLLANLDLLESRWGELAAMSDALPRTLVHGDFVPKNLRIHRDGASVGLAVFDWEMAGFGTQAPDLAQLLEPEPSAAPRRRRMKRLGRFSANPCLDTYRFVLAGFPMDLDPETVERSAAAGNLFRCVAGIDWTCSVATSTWSPVDDLRLYSSWLDNAMKLIGWSSGHGRVLEAR
jgi:hypothetical protein